jgi:hypothetical protein
MLYTVRPLERIYASPSVFDKRKNNTGEENTDNRQQMQEDDYREVLLPNGRIVTRRDGDNYVIEKINSTRMSDYLNENYFPGKTIKHHDI